MRMWITPIGLFRRPSPRRAAEEPRAEGTAAVAPQRDAADEAACDRLLRELASSALLVTRGVATRVVVCNAPGSIDFDEVRLIADTFDVAIEPVVRVGGGGFDFAVVRRRSTGD